MSDIANKYLSRFDKNKALQERIETCFKELSIDISLSWAFDEISFSFYQVAKEIFGYGDDEKPLFLKGTRIPVVSPIFNRATLFGDVILGKGSLLITDKALYYIGENPDYGLDVPPIEWKNMSRVTFKNNEIFIQRQQNKEDTSIKKGYWEIVGNKLVMRPIKINASTFGKKADVVAKLLNDIALYEHDRFFDYKKFITNKDYQTAINEIDNLINLGVVTDEMRYDKSQCLLYLIDSLKVSDKRERYIREAEFELNTILQLDINEDKRLVNLSDVYYLKSKVEKYKNNIASERKHLIKSLSTPSNIEQNNRRKELSEYDYAIADTYIDAVDWKDRKLVMILDDVSVGYDTTSIEVFKISSYPKHIIFPVGHPKKGELYIGHPYKKNLYIPFIGHEEEFFMDKITEFSTLLQSLGATDIEVEYVKGKNVSELRNNAFHADGSINAGSFGNASAEYNHTNKRDSNSYSNKRIEQLYKSDPQKSPYVPDGMVWLPQETVWQRLVAQRTNGNNLLQFSERISTKETRFMSDTDMETLKADIRVLSVKANLNISESSLSKKETTEETEWVFNAKFKSINEFSKAGKFTNNAKSSLSENEDKYLEEVMFCLEDGMNITETDRKYLERKRVKFDVSESRAKEIEDMCMPRLTKEELEYVDLLKEYKKEDLHTPGVRRILDRERVSLGISEQRAKELEENI